MASNGTTDAGGVSKYETEEGLKEVASFLRGRNGMPLRPAIEMDKRVEYFKGEMMEYQSRSDCKCKLLWVCALSRCRASAGCKKMNNNVDIIPDIASLLRPDRAHSLR